MSTISNYASKIEVRSAIISPSRPPHTILYEWDFIGSNTISNQIL
ncbi:hypothetical protein HanIR_Chr10g0457771 [Helianthus annuus]|nr:hypothetical protein HanIR_Chr10g0457771 [Helianthus annuus]